MVTGDGRVKGRGDHPINEWCTSIDLFYLFCVSQLYYHPQYRSYYTRDAVTGQYDFHSYAPDTDEQEVVEEEENDGEFLCVRLVTVSSPALKSMFWSASVRLYLNT